MQAAITVLTDWYEKKVRTGRYPESLVRLAEFHREEGHERVDEVVSLAHQMEGGSEAQICWRHLV